MRRARLVHRRKTSICIPFRNLRVGPLNQTAHLVRAIFHQNVALNPITHQSIVPLECALLIQEDFAVDCSTLTPRRRVFPV
jgi:hypothetical protein